LICYSTSHVRSLTDRNSTSPRRPSLLSPDFRLSLALSSILFWHRLLYRFFARLRNALRSNDATNFCQRNPWISRTLRSKLTPAFGASLAGFFLGVIPASQTRVTIAIYTLTRALEFLYNSLELEGYLRLKPWWVGSWMIMPPACGQLLHAFIFDRDGFPNSIGDMVLNRSPAYIHSRPTTLSTTVTWPSRMDIIDSLAETSGLQWPALIPPILFPKYIQTPSSTRLSRTAPLTNEAHPAIKRLSCAILHPHDPSCVRTFLNYYLKAFPAMSRLFTLVYGVIALTRYEDFLEFPLKSVNALAAKILRTSFFLTSAIGTIWSSSCLLQRLLSAKFMPTSRWLLSGFLAGAWAFVDRGAGRSNFMYSARLSLDSLWKVGKKRRWWKGVRGGDVWLFVASLCMINVLFERRPMAVQGAAVRKALGVFRAQGWVDCTADSEEDTAELDSDTEASPEAEE